MILNKKQNRGFTPTPILTLLQSFCSIIFNKVKFINRFESSNDIKKQQKTIPNLVSGFTLLELLTVVAIIGLMATFVLGFLNDARKRARDTQRISDMQQIQNALELYYTDNGNYPVTIDDDCSGWDAGFVGTGDTFIEVLSTGNYMQGVIGDPLSTSCSMAYRYNKFSAGTSGCDVSKGAYYVLGVNDIESASRPHPDSPGFSCSGRDFQDEFDWVVGKFERDQ